MNKFIKFWDKIEENLLIFLISVMGMALLLQIIVRFVFGFALPWPEEFGRYCQIWITFLGIGYGVRKNTHVGMNLLSEKYSETMKHIVDIFSNGLGIFGSIILLISSLKFISIQNVLSTAMQIPMYLVYAVIPISAVLSTIYYLANSVDSMKQLKKGRA
ncbi:hypothetical protein AN639_02785 [Candidatus Epulonipiscium fishelsonii]|uniref:Uncharacterized protein n=1 Tax=Candidatus Epulonipiscium fishelsonii TaxID=77094 RepID=A0ACC8X9A5_9FIRM|nr:hypothetical protein AN396_10140 [Epulopiscium sp. SCG-B11WGA-EpuloA1]ONI41868.1 hypothetical protein AN639_02785 [Epulopiscium sp. SCG-B05WGA-EpuloA1]